VTFTYDALNRQETVSRAAGQTATTVYDSAGNVARTIDETGATATFGYDAANRKVTEQRPGTGTATTAYDLAGNVVSTTDALGHTVTSSYDNDNRLVKSVDALSGTTTYQFDEAGNRTVVIDPLGNRTTTAYDTQNRATSETDPLNHTATMAYDLAGRLASRTDRLGRRIDYTYDADGRLSTEVWKDAGGATVNTLTHTYDNSGNELTAADGHGAYTMTYDDAGRQRTVKGMFGTTLTYTYDGQGNRTRVEDNFGGVTTSAYDTKNQLTGKQFGGAGQTQLREDFAYTARGDLATATRYSDVAGTTVVGTTAYSFDGAGRLTNLNHKNGSGTSLANYTYTYDNADRVSTEVRNGTTTSYNYDDTNQVTGDGTRNYSYDANGNRTMNGYTTGTGNQLTNDGTYTYTYDSEGNLSEKGKGASGDTWDYAYDNKDHMTSATERSSPGGALLTAATYVYDVYGNRIETDVWTQASGKVTVTRMAYDGQNAWADLDAGNALVTRRLYGDGVDKLLARIAGGTGGSAGWYLTDHLGSVRNVTDGTGALAGTLSYDPFGNALANTGSTDRYQFTGREMDSVTGLQYNRARYYDAATGRWLSKDPLGFEPGDLNLYRYAGNDSTNVTDPAGRDPWDSQAEKVPADIVFFDEILFFFDQKNDTTLERLKGIKDLSKDDKQQLAAAESIHNATQLLRQWRDGKDPGVKIHAYYLPENGGEVEFLLHAMKSEPGSFNVYIGHGGQREGEDSMPPAQPTLSLIEGKFKKAPWTKDDYEFKELLKDYKAGPKFSFVCCYEGVYNKIIPDDNRVENSPKAEKIVLKADYWNELAPIIQTIQKEVEKRKELEKKEVKVRPVPVNLYFGYDAKRPPGSTGFPKDLTHRFANWK
jgi:RHS repeat-associated protein